jgi:hypothetical protein
MRELTDISIGFLGPLGKLISSSKSGYRDRNPDNLVQFNANVCNNSAKIWWGDLDITISKENLASLSIAINSDIYVLREIDGRFENEDNPKIQEFIVKFSPDGKIAMGRFYEDFVL